MSRTPITKKYFGKWIKIKENTHFRGSISPFSEGQIWWAAVGENVGVEINGKNEDFSRPVLIYKKLSKLSFLAIPLTSQPHEGSWYASFRFKNKEQYAVLCQIRMLSVTRLYNRMGKISQADFKKIKRDFQKLIQ